MTPYHPGELAAQERAGVVDEAARLVGMFRREVPPPAESFLAEQPMLVLGAADDDGSVWATMLTGRPGFLSVDGGSTLVVAARPGPADPLRQALEHTTRVGMIAIQPGTRRRVRMNGVAAPVEEGLRVELEQVYANCPKYIQKREPSAVAGSAGSKVESTALSSADLALVGEADTFFVASVGPDGSADASHRGGAPGFLRATSPTSLTWPDYVGNAMFNTLGNLGLDPRVGLLVPDWSTGDLLHVSGRAVVDWDPAHAAAVPGAERLVDVAVDRVVRIEGASPLRWSEPEQSRFNPPVR